ncbi:MAG: ribose-phosphate pyrophosphokinase [Microgenomates group bacterium]|nr:ribose-phosphate pyrophosphokinase [Microgenomates group bacterium]
MKLFTGSSHPDLANEVAEVSGLPLSQAEVVRFDNSEVKVTIKESVKNQDCLVLQSTCNPTDSSLMELFFFADALKRGGASKIFAFIPYFGYARQNKEHRPGEAVSVNVVIRFLETVGFNQVFFFDLHDEATEGIFSIPCQNLSALPLLAQNLKNYLTINNKNKKIAIVSPDQGGVERARIFAENFFQKKKADIVVVEKKRDLERIHQSKAVKLYGDVKGKIAILVDDIITSGGTLIHAAEFCLKEGAVEVLAAVVHHDFSPQAPTLIQNSPISKLFTTNTIPLKNHLNFPKLHEISVAGLIAEAIKKI